MSTLSRRVQKLESHIGGSTFPQRVIVMKSNGASEERLHAFLAIQGKHGKKF